MRKIGDETIVEVAVAAPVDRIFYYRVPEELSGRDLSGMKVNVPFGRRIESGYIVGYAEDISQVNGEMKYLKEITDDMPSFTPDMLKFYRWVADYYISPLGIVLDKTIPDLKIGSRRCSSTQNNLHGGPDEVSSKPFILTDEQNEAVSALNGALDENRFETFLIHGVTGSGKTEVYIRIIAETLKKERSAIVLVPEISLTPQMISRFTQRFGGTIASLHSAMSKGARSREWKRIRDGDAKIVVGARSAIFAPVKDLGVIIVDEEHDQSYKQDESPRYNARDLAVVRGKMAGSLVLLGSATPSMESYHNAESGRFRYIRLSARIENRPMPDIIVVDMKNSAKSPILSRQLAECLGESLQKRKQSLLFLNRRGFSTTLICSKCGHTFRCPNCSISLTYHRSEGLLKCHYCDYSQKSHPLCGGCGDGKIDLLGHGTEKVEDEIRKLFPDARIARMDRDTVSRKGAHQRILKDLEEEKTDILIGTQMITKGHDYPNITAVGVISADSSLNLPDFRATERTFQLITQVAGRAGRGNEPGKVVVQTYNPDNYGIKAAIMHDQESFYKEESGFRKDLGYPPYFRMINVRLRGNSEAGTSRAAEELGLLCRSESGRRKGIGILGPSPAAISKIKGKFRWNMIIRGKDSAAMHEFTRSVISKFSMSSVFKGIELQIDVDPVVIL